MRHNNIVHIHTVWDYFARVVFLLLSIYLRLHVLMTHIQNPYLLCSTAVKQRPSIKIENNPDATSKSFDACFEDIIEEPNVNIDEDQRAVYKTGGKYVGKVWVVYVGQNAANRHLPVYWHCPVNANAFGLYYKQQIGPHHSEILTPINFFEMKDIKWAGRETGL